MTKKVTKKKRICLCGGAPLAPEEAAEFLGVRPATLRDWRKRGVGPGFLKLEGSRVRYTQADLHDYLDEQWLRTQGKNVQRRKV